MDVQSAESELTKTPKLRWLAREKESGRIYDWAAIGSAIVLVGMLVLSYAVLSREAAPGSMLSPPQIALLLIANLIPSIALMVLLQLITVVLLIGYEINASIHEAIRAEALWKARKYRLKHQLVR